MNVTHQSRQRRPDATGARRATHAWRVAVIALPAGLALMTTGCWYDEEGSGEMATVHYDDLDDHDITGLSVLDDFDVRVIVDPSVAQSAEVVVDDNLVDRGYASLDDDGMLTIGFDGLGLVDPSETPQVTLMIHELDTLENHGEGDVRVTGLTEGTIEVVNSDEGTVTAHGEADSVELHSTGSGTVDLTELVAETVELSETDDGDIAVHATDAIEGEISGDADVVVYGDPASTDVDVDGAGALVTA